jgi:hypothetical protein
LDVEKQLAIFQFCVTSTSTSFLSAYLKGPNHTHNNGGTFFDEAAWQIVSSSIVNRAAVERCKEPSQGFLVSDILRSLPLAPSHAQCLKTMNSNPHQTHGYCNDERGLNSEAYIEAQGCDKLKVLANTKPEKVDIPLLTPMWKIHNDRNRRLFPTELQCAVVDFVHLFFSFLSDFE